MTDEWCPESGELIWIDFSPTLGTEQRGRRPTLVVSATAYNRLTGRALVMPVTSRSRGWSTEVPVVADAIGGVVLTDQLRSVDWRARRAQPAGRVAAAVLLAAREALATLAEIA